MTKLKSCILFTLLISLTISVFAWNPPVIQCIKLLNNNTRIHVDWESNPDCMHFKVYYFYVNGVLADSLNASPSESLYLHGGKDVNNIPSANQYNCYIVAVDSNNNSCQSNTLQSITLTVTPNTNHTAANISWESPTTNFDNTWGTVFNIYKKREFESDFPAQPFATVPVTQQLTYTDPADVCNSSISYQVGISHFYMNGTNQAQCPFMTTIGTVENMVDTVQPSLPVLDSVTVTPNNQVMLGFHETEPYMMAFIIYYINPNGNIPLDTIYGQTYWIDPVIDPNNDSRSYKIATMDSCGSFSNITDEQCNMILHLKSTDACHRSVSIQWSTYPHLINGIDHFEIMLSSDGGASWENIGSTTSNTFTIENLVINTDYKVYVRVVNNGATVTASTNRINVRISAEETEDFTYIRSVSVIENRFIQIKVLTSGMKHEGGIVR